MSALLPDRVRPAELADGLRRVAGKVPASRLRRLADRLASTSGALEVILDFSRGEAKQGSTRGIEVHGRIAGTLCLACQRCLGPLEQALEIKVALGLVGDAAQMPPGDLEPWVVPRDEASLIALVEDEVLLDLPMYPMHGADACAESVTAPVGTEPQHARARPFAGLSDLLREVDAGRAPDGEGAAERLRRKPD